MLPELGAIIDRVYKGVSSRRLPQKRLIVIVGNGIRNVSNILNDDQVLVEARKRGYSPGTTEFEQFKWRLFEYARYHTANSLPTYAHCCIYRMLSDKACSHVITTNYDLYFDSIWRKYPNLNVHTNPLAKKGEYLWDGYYSPKTRGRPRSYWKIHGSLSHGVFLDKHSPNQAGVLVSLPRMAIPSNQPDIAKAYGLATTSPYLGFEACSYSSAFPAFSDLDSHFRPFIDWTYKNDRSAFHKEIKSVQSILTNTAEFDAILLLGFRGYYNDRDGRDPWNEELIPTLIDLVKSGFSNIFMAVHRLQAKTVSDPSSKFLRDRLRADRAGVYSDAGVWMRNVVAGYTRYFPYRAVDAEHAKWANYYYLTDAETQHL